MKDEILRRKRPSCYDQTKPSEKKTNDVLVSGAFKSHWDKRIGSLFPTTVANSLSDLLPQSQMPFVQLVALIDLSMSGHQGDLGSQCGGEYELRGSLGKRTDL